MIASHLSKLVTFAISSSMFKMNNPGSLGSTGRVGDVGLVVLEDAPDGLPRDEHGDGQHQQHPEHADYVVSSPTARTLGIFSEFIEP